MSNWDKNCQYFIDTSAIIGSNNLFNSSQIHLSMHADFFCVVIICLHWFSVSTTSLMKPLIFNKPCLKSHSSRSCIEQAFLTQKCSIILFHQVNYVNSPTFNGLLFCCLQTALEQNSSPYCDKESHTPRASNITVFIYFFVVCFTSCQLRLMTLTMLGWNCWSIYWTTQGDVCTKTSWVDTRHGQSICLLFHMITSTPSFLFVLTAFLKACSG